MTYKHLTTCELTLIADFWHQGTKAYQAAKLLKRSQETIYRIYRFLDSGKMAGRLIRSLVGQNGRLAVVCEPFIECLPAGNTISTSDNYQ